MKTEEEIKDYILKIHEDILKYQKDEFPISKEVQSLWEGWISGLKWVISKDPDKCSQCGAILINDK